MPLTATCVAAEIATSTILPSARFMLRRSPVQVLEQLVGDASLEKFRKEYEKLHTHLKKVRG